MRRIARFRNGWRWLTAFPLLSVAACAKAPEYRRAIAPAPSPAASSPGPSAEPVERRVRKPKVIVFVWDGLRPDSVSEQTTPNLARLRDRGGVNFTDHHAAYPTFTMMNAAAFATGAYPGRHGFYGNTEYQPGASGKNAEGKSIDFAQPVFTEEHGVLQALDAFYRARGSRGIFAVETLFEAAHRAGLRTAAIGKIGPAFLQDRRPDEALSVVLDENIALPFRFAQGLQAAGLSLPVNAASYPYPDGQALLLAPNNGKPTAISTEKLVRLQDGVTADPRATTGSAHNASNGYLMNAYLTHVLPKLDPDLSFIWLRNPDSTEHQFGPGSPNYLDALRDQDTLLGNLQAKLTELGLLDTTDLIVVSDHGHSTVAGDPKLFPLRALGGAADGHGVVGAPASDGYVVSGQVRSADVLERAGFRHIYDGGGCGFDPVLYGIRKDGSLVYPTQVDTTGKCGSPVPVAAGEAAKVRYSTASFRVPATIAADSVVIAANGGSDYFYVLDHNAARVRALVRALQERPAFGAIFVRSSYGEIAGTLPLSAINAEASSPPTPDLIVSFAWDDTAVSAGNAGIPGTEYSSSQHYRGMHGSFSPRDVHNTLIASGSHFKVGFADSLPTGNVDLAPTIAALLGFHFDAPDGRVLREAFAKDDSGAHVEVVNLSSEPIHLARTCGPDDPDCKRPTRPRTYRVTLMKKILTVSGTNQRYTYFDRAFVTR